MSYIEEILLGKKALDRRAARLLRRAVNEHPYSQVLHTLYAKALMVNGKGGLGKASSRALLCAPNRRLYKEFMHRSLPGGLIPPQGKEAVEPRQERDGGMNEPQEREAGQRRDFHALIDRFLETSPRIGQVKTDVPEGELSRQSIEDHPDLVSETLAEVLVKQGKTERAKGIYKKLSLMFPEKSAYFAKKIDSI